MHKRSDGCTSMFPSQSFFNTWFITGVSRNNYFLFHIFIISHHHCSFFFLTPFPTHLSFYRNQSHSRRFIWIDVFLPHTYMYIHNVLHYVSLKQAGTRGVEDCFSDVENFTTCRSRTLGSSSYEGSDALPSWKESIQGTCK